MKTLYLSIITIFVTTLTISVGAVAAQYGPGFYPPVHYAPTNDTKLELQVMNSTEFKERTAGYNYTLAGIDYNWIPKGYYYYELGGARVTFLVWGFGNATTKGEAFNLDSQMRIKSIFEYNADNPPPGYYTDRCNGGCPAMINNTKPQCCGPPYVPKTLDTPLKQFKSGIQAQDVQCEVGDELILKLQDGSPACVKPDTAQKLIERGWAESESTQSHTIKNTAQTNPLGISALVEFAPINMNWNSGPNYHFYLKISSNSTAYLLGYNICGKDFCVKNNTSSILLPITKLQIGNYTEIGLSENQKWNYGDTVNMQLEVSQSIYNKTAYFLDIKNSTIVP